MTDWAFIHISSFKSSDRAPEQILSSSFNRKLRIIKRVLVSDPPTKQEMAGTEVNPKGKPTRRQGPLFMSTRGQEEVVTAVTGTVPSAHGFGGKAHSDGSVAHAL